jgi:hypothetical protein
VRCGAKSGEAVKEKSDSERRNDMTGWIECRCGKKSYSYYSGFPQKAPDRLFSQRKAIGAVQREKRGLADYVNVI